MLLAKNYEPRGCWNDGVDDDNNRAMTDIDKDIDESFGHYRIRPDPKQNCLDAALGRGLRFFALQDQGQCFGTDDEKNYKKYGKLEQCDHDWKGGEMQNYVYEIKTGRFLWCYNSFYPFKRTNNSHCII